MTPAIRIAIQLVGTKQGRSMIGSILLAVVSFFLIPIILIGGAVTSFLGYLSNDTDVFAEAKNQVKEEMKVHNDMDEIFIRYLYLDSEEIPEKQNLVWAVKILFLKRFDDPEIMERIRILSESLAAAPPEDREQISNELTELYALSSQLARYEFKSQEEILLLFEGDDSDLIDEQIEELKLFLGIIDEIKEGDG